MSSIENLEKSSSIGHLPSDLILSISDHLPIHGVACLALTCKDMFSRNDYLNNIWKRHFSTKEALDGDDYLKTIRPDLISLERLELLEVLLKERPDSAVCDYCQKIIPRRELCKVDWSSWDWPYLGARYFCPCRGRLSLLDRDSMSLHYKTWSIHYSFEHFRQVMYRRRLGKSRGAPSEMISVNSDWRLRKSSHRYRAAWLEKIEIEPLFKGYNLVLHVTQRILISQRYLLSIKSSGLEKSHLIDWLVESRIKACHCEDPANIAQLQACTASLLDAMENDSSSESVCEEPDVQECRSCLTSYILDLRRHPHHEVLELTLDSWTDLGQCKHTFSAEWLAVQTHPTRIYNRNKIVHAKTIIYHTFQRPSQKMILKKRASEINHPSLAHFRWDQLTPKPTFGPKQMAFRRFRRAASAKCLDRLRRTCLAIGSPLAEKILASIICTCLFIILAPVAYLLFCICRWMGVGNTGWLTVCLGGYVYYDKRRYGYRLGA